MRLLVNVGPTFRFSFKIELFFLGNSSNLRHLPTEMTSLPFMQRAWERSQAAVPFNRISKPTWRPATNLKKQERQKKDAGWKWQVAMFMKSVCKICNGSYLWVVFMDYNLYLVDRFLVPDADRQRRRRNVCYVCSARGGSHSRKLAEIYHHEKV